MNKVGIILTLLFAFSGLKSIGQPKMFDAYLLNEPQKHKEVLLSKFELTEISTFDYILENNTILLENGYAQFNIKNPEIWQEIATTSKVIEVNLIYTKYPINKEDWLTEYHGLLANRVKALLALDSNLNRTDIEWKITLQTNCPNAVQAKRLFHGIAIRYTPLSSNTPPLAVDTTAEVLPSLLPNVPSAPIRVAVNLNESSELSDADKLERLKTELPDTLLQKIESLTPEKQTLAILEYYALQPKTNLPRTDLEAAFVAEKKTEIEEFINTFGGNTSSVDGQLAQLMTRQTDLDSTLVVMDWTGSMYRYGAEIMLWHLLNFKNSGILHFVFFNDGDKKQTFEKKIGETGGIYAENAQNIEELLNLFRLVMLKGGGGDAPENDIEAILEGINKFPWVKKVVLIADNNACVRDMTLLSKVNKPVKVVLCGYNDLVGANPQFIQIALKTNGSIHTTERDLMQIDEKYLPKEKDLELRNADESLVLVVRANCDLVRSGFTATYRTDRVLLPKPPEPPHIAKIYHSLETALNKKDSVYRLALVQKELVEVPSEVKMLPNLKALNISKNELTEVSEVVFQIPNLYQINLSGNKLSKLPKKIETLTQLSELDISQNQLKAVADNLVDIEKLELLDLSNNQIRKLPKNVISLEKLRELYLQKNELDKLPVDIGLLHSLERLDASHNRLQALPEWLGSWSKMVYLNFSYNQLTNIPSSLQHCKTLTYFNAEHNQLTEPPVGIIGMKSILELDLSHNQIATLPSGIGNLIALVNLDLSYNQIATLPYRIGQLKNLKKLDLSHNQINRFPKEFKHLKQLEWLDLTGNPLKPEIIQELKKSLPSAVVKF